MKQSINKQQLAIEFLSVVFAVILALILNGWRESLSLKENLRKVKETIVAETLKNDSLIQKSHAYRGDLLQQLYANEYELLAAPTSEFPFEVSNNDKLASFFRTLLIFESKDYYDRVLVLQEKSKRVLVLDDKVFDIIVKNDTLRILGVGNIRLKTPELSNHSYHLAQATETTVKMDIKLVEKLTKVNSLNEVYAKMSDYALQMVYDGNQKGIISSIEEMYGLETEILEANADLLEALKGGIK